jgi:hypothetical protein
MATSNTQTVEPAPRPLSPARKEKLRIYWAKLDKGARGCRLGRRHWILGIEEYDGNDEHFTITPVSGLQGVWQITTYCSRCGMPYVYAADRRTGHIEMRGRPDYTKIPGYLFTEENGGDGTPMTVQDMDYLRKIQLDDVLESLSFKAARRAPKFKPEAEPVNGEPLVMGKVPADLQFSSAG